MSKFVDDNKIRVSSTDTVADFLAQKMEAGTNISISVSGSYGNETVVISATGAAVTSHVGVSATDTTPDFLSDKIISGDGTTFTIENPGGNEQILVEGYGSSISSGDTTIGYLSDKLTAGPGVTLTTENVGGAETLRIDAYGIDQQQVFYVGKHGNDTYDGLSLEKAFLTFGAALSAASVAGPSASDKFAIVCQDAGIYDELLTVDAYVNVFAPNATLAPSAAGTALTVSYNSFVTFRGISPQASGSIAISKTNTAGDAPNVVVGRIDLADSSFGVLNLSLSTIGELIVNCGAMYLQDSCYGVGDLATNIGHTHIYTNDIYFLGTGSTGIVAANSGNISGRVDHILNYGSGTGNTALTGIDGEINLTIEKIDCDIAYNVTGTSVLNLKISNISGEEIVDSESNRNILEANGPVGLGFVPGRVDNQDGYGIWSRRTSDSLALYSSRSNESGAKSVIAVADVNAALIDPDHKIMSFQWIDNVDGYHEVWYVKEQEVTATEASMAALLGTDPDAGFSIGVQIGSDEEYTSTGSKLVSVVNDANEKAYIDFSGNLGINKLANGQECSFKALSELYSVPASADGYTSIRIPQYSIVIGVSSYVVVSIPGASTFDIGVDGDGTRYGSVIPALVGVSHPGTDYPMSNYTSAERILITPDATPSAATGRVRVTIHYIEIVPASS